MNKLSVYVIRVKDTDYVKIGSSRNVPARIASLQTGCPLELELIGLVEATRYVGLESALHEAFKEHRTRAGNEWYVVAPELIFAEADRLSKEWERGIARPASIFEPPPNWPGYMEFDEAAQRCSVTLTRLIQLTKGYRVSQASPKIPAQLHEGIHWNQVRIIRVRGGVPTPSLVPALTVEGVSRLQEIVGLVETIAEPTP